MAGPVFETCHVACCANRTPNVVCWGRGGTIAFGTCHSVALYDPLVVEFLCWLCKVRWTPGSPAFENTDVPNKCVLFQEKRVLSLLNGHTGRVNVVKWIHKPDCGEEGEEVTEKEHFGMLCYRFSRARIDQVCMWYWVARIDLISNANKIIINHDCCRSSCH